MSSRALFTPIKLRELTIRNRIFVSPMCQYSAEDGVPNNWHLVHLGSRAVGGAGLVMAEATGIRPTGRISPGDTGIWSDKHVEAFKPITQFIREQGAVAAIQLAHAGRKASMSVPWEGDHKVEVKDGGWIPDAPSPIAFADHYPTPHELTATEIDALVEDFATAAKRAHAAGFQVIELHMAHGYLLNEFLSPISNKRTDQYGGSLENRMRFPLQVAKAVRAVWPKELPLFVRISATDWAEQGGWDLEQSVVLAKELKKAGVDLIDCSTGGILNNAKIPVGLGYQVSFSDAIRKQANIPTSAVGLIVSPQQAEDILQNGQADVVSLARELLRNPYFPLHAAYELEVDIEWPKQYARAKRVKKH